MATLRKVCVETKTKKVDLDEVLKELLSVADGSMSINRIWFRLQDLNSSFRIKFLKRNDFFGGELLFSVTELQEALNRLVKTSILSIELYHKGAEGGVEVGFRRIS